LPVTASARRAGIHGRDPRERRARVERCERLELGVPQHRAAGAVEAQPALAVGRRLDLLDRNQMRRGFEARRRSAARGLGDVPAFVAEQHALIVRRKADRANLRTGLGSSTLAVLHIDEVELAVETDLRRSARVGREREGRDLFRRDQPLRAGRHGVLDQPYRLARSAPNDQPGGVAPRERPHRAAAIGEGRRFRGRGIDDQKRALDVADREPAGVRRERRAARPRRPGALRHRRGTVDVQEPQLAVAAARGDAFPPRIEGHESDSLGVRR
jgi:hypothetical protein